MIGDLENITQHQRRLELRRLETEAGWKGLSENSENLAGEKKPPFKEVWWGRLNSLGKNAAVAEAFGLNPRENWLDLANLAALARLKKITWSLQGDGPGRGFLATTENAKRFDFAIEPGEALAQALLWWAGVRIHFEPKPLEAQASAGREGL